MQRGAGGTTRLRPVQWLFTGVLLALCGGITVFTGYLLRRLFTTAPGERDVPAEPKP
ncbi:hypothetical protein GCM10009559_77020 [Pseudonocardia zijingensis]|uniref:Uncharacterized protein n=1 Tax=Pseudonocardia zijingensis TaxID=153376 RepID=A0ABP3YVG5_9PSEU